MKVIHSILSFSPSIALSQAIVCILLAFSPAAYSKNINPRKAAKIAQRYVTLPQSQEVKAKSKGFSQTADTPYYIYNDARGSGFVIVSGDDEMGEILAYSTEGTLDTLNANPCVKFLLEGYRQTYEVLKEGKVVVGNATRSGLFSQTVSPLLKSRWGQSYPLMPVLVTPIADVWLLPSHN